MKKFRPFWSYRVEETEKWLGEMAEQGYSFKKFNRVFRTFDFEKKQASSTRYLIEFNSDAGMYENGGWQKVQQAGKWTVFEGDAPSRFSTRGNVFQRFRSHYLWATTLLALLFIYLNTTVSFIMAVRFEQFSIIYFIGVLLVLITIFTCGILWLNKKYYAKEKAYLNIHHKIESNAIRKRRPGWMYLQYLTRLWLERMFARGYELDYAKGFTFYFKPRESANISFEIVNDKPKNSGAFLFYKESGWEAKLLQNNLMLHTSIWSKSYEDGEKKPQLSYSSKERLKSIRKGFLFANSFSVMFILLMVMNVYNMTQQMKGEMVLEIFAITLMIISILCGAIWSLIFIYNVYGFIQQKKELREVGLK